MMSVSSNQIQVIKADNIIMLCKIQKTSRQRHSLTRCEQQPELGFTAKYQPVQGGNEQRALRQR